MSIMFLKHPVYKALFVSSILLMLAFSVKAQEYETYYSMDEMPDAGVYLPCPTAFESSGFAGDFIKWQWGRSIRNTERGMMASDDSKFGIDCMVKIFGQVLGIEISNEATPAIWKLMYRSGKTGRSSITKAKAKYMRIRPFTKMNEHTFGKYDDEEDLRYNGSYPSGHTVFGWSVTLALAEMAPEYQDAILRRGLMYGESRVIVGAHWKSDVDAALLAASAALARLHTSPMYLSDLAEARKEFSKLKNLSVTINDISLPNGKSILPSPVSDSSYDYYGDVADYWLARLESDSLRKLQAFVDADLSDSALLRGFAPCLHVNTSKTNTPHIRALFSFAAQTFMKEAYALGEGQVRSCPIEKFDDTTLFPVNQDVYAPTSSFPSVQAAVGWGLALVLAEIVPDYQDSILMRGFEYGRSGVIMGYHYASDVQAGRIMASYVYTQLHNNPEFLSLLWDAKLEYIALSQWKRGYRTLKQ